LTRDAPVAERYRAARRDRGLAVLEGLHAIKHALRFGAEVLDARTRDRERLGELARELAPDVADRVMELAQPVGGDGFDTLAPSPHPTGVIALARRPSVDVTRLLAGDPGAPVVLLERPTHHGNIGAVVRVSAAAGAAGVLVTGPHDPWHPSSIRGGAGLQFALPVASLEGAEAVFESARTVVVLDPEGEPLAPGGASLPAGCVMVFGSERTGVSGALAERADLRVSIPMRPGVSSLNLATAVAVTLYLAGAGDASWGRP
jgi:RNA methyltransferase, TrmH family